MPLTDAKIRALKPETTVKKHSDGDGLQLWVTPAGSKLWNLAYRFAGAQRKLSLGAYPGVTLQQARKARDDAKALLASGVDPGQQKKAEKANRQISEANTFGAVAAELLAKKKREGRAATTLSKTEWLFDLAGADFSQRPIGEITAAEVLAVLRKAEQRGRLETARRMRSAYGEVFRFAIATSRCAADPTAALKGALTAPVVKNRAAVIDPIAFGGLLRAIAAYDGQPTTRLALQLLALTAARPGEVRHAEWQEFDLDKSVWVVPAIRAKMRREHRVPLSRQALAVLDELRPLTGHGRLLFQGYGVGSRAGKPVEPRPISENTLCAALRRMGYGGDDASAHGFRSSFSTLANESGKWSPDAIERCLAHVDGDSIRAAYARGSYWAERTSLMQWWADECDRMRKGGEMVPFAKGVG